MPAYKDTFSDIALGDIVSLAERKKEAGSRFVEIHATTLEDGFLLNYAYTDDEQVCDNYRVKIDTTAVVPSISGIFLAAFFFENETHDLFGIDIEGIAIDFNGNFYQVSLEAPMARKTEDSDMFAVNRHYDARNPIKQRKGGE